MTSLIDLMERLPAALLDTLTAAAQHPGTVVAIVLTGATLGAYGFISTHFHRRGR